MKLSCLISEKIGGFWGAIFKDDQKSSERVIPTEAALLYVVCFLRPVNTDSDS